MIILPSHPISTHSTGAYCDDDTEDYVDDPEFGCDAGVLECEVDLDTRNNITITSVACTNHNLCFSGALRARSVTGRTPGEMDAS